MRFPSKQNLMNKLDISLERADLLRAVAKAQSVEEIMSMDNYLLTPAKSWVIDCWHRPSLNELKKRTINSLIDCFGIEFLGVYRNKGKSVQYCNAGDSYAPTIIFIGNDYAYIGCWGDLIEKGLVVHPCDL